MSPHQSGAEVLLSKARAVIGTNLENEHFGVSELARALGMSRSNLHRKVKTVTGKSVSQLIREVRLQKAMELLKDSGLTVSEVAYRVGFGSATYFTKCFHDQFGFPPGETAQKNIHEDLSPASVAETSITYPGKRRIPVPWIITSLIAIASAILLIITFKPFPGKNPSADLVIAILPFRNDSPNSEYDYIINGLMEEILNKLTLIKELNVVSRTTSELYRDSDKSLKEIGAELQADYILEGSATIINNNTRIRLQLIEPVTDRHLWSKPFEREITLENIFQVQEEVAIAVTAELKVILKPEEKELINKQPTENLEAYEAYLRALEIQQIVSLQGGKNSHKKILNSKRLLDHAIALDSTFSDAYTQLGHVYINFFYLWELYDDIEKAYAYLDTGLFFVEKAFSYYESDHKNVQSRGSQSHVARSLKATYYQLNGMPHKAEQYLQESNKDNPGDFWYYQSVLSWNTYYNNYYATIEGYLKYLERMPEGYIVPIWIHTIMYSVFRGSGFPELARQHSEQMLTLSGDSIAYLWRMIELESYLGNYKESIRYTGILSELDPGDLSTFNWLSKNHISLGDFETAARLTRQGVDRLKQEGEEIEPNCTIGYVYQMLGEKEMADYHLKGDISNLTLNLKYPSRHTQVGYNHLHIARVYSILGDVGKTQEYLVYLKDLPHIDILMITGLKDWPSYDLVRETAEFKEILSHMETIYQKEHDRIEILLKKEGYI